ncbi:glucose 1-dehydrogenase [Okibacterium endophyticum]
MAEDLTDRIAVVSGGARGLGAAHAAALVDAGARVLIGDVRDDDGHATARSLGSAALYAHLDVTDERSWADAVAAAERHWNSDVTVLVNNAGVNEPQPLMDLTLAAWQRTLDINLTGHFLGIQAVVPSMIRAGGGSIVNTSSMVATLAVSDLAHYTASKTAIVGLTKVAALELGAHGIRVNCLQPGFIDTAMMEGAPREQLTRDLPVPRYGRADEVAEMMVAIVRSTYSTGSAFAVDGGVVAGMAHG